MISSLRTRTIAIFLVDAALMCLCVYLVLRFRCDATTFAAIGGGQVRLLMLLCAAVLLGAFQIFDLYHFRLLRNTAGLYARLLAAMGISCMALTILLCAVPGLRPFMGDIQVSMASILLIMGLWRPLARWFCENPSLAERVLILGTEQSAVDLVREVMERSEQGHRVIGFVGDDSALVGKSLINPCVLGLTCELEEIVNLYKVDRVVIALDDLRGKLPLRPLLALKLRGEVSIEERASFYENLTGKIPTDKLRPSMLIFAEDTWFRRVYRRIRRVLDVAMAAVTLVLAFPLMILIAILVRLSSPGSILYGQERVGLLNKPFRMWKFRSMLSDAEVEGPMWARLADPRMTGIGRILRRFHLDELPQLFNVLRGEMSFIGPRPERPGFVELLEGQIPFYSQRHFVKPGLTGWAQVRCPYGASIQDTFEKLQHDFYYIKNQSPLLDLIILLETARIALFGRLSR